MNWNSLFGNKTWAHWLLIQDNCPIHLAVLLPQRRWQQHIISITYLAHIPHSNTHEANSFSLRKNNKTIYNKEAKCTFKNISKLVVFRADVFCFHFLVMGDTLLSKYSETPKLWVSSKCYHPTFHVVEENIFAYPLSSPPYYSRMPPSRFSEDARRSGNQAMCPHFNGQPQCGLKP